MVKRWTVITRLLFQLRIELVRIFAIYELLSNRIQTALRAW
jgi:hypothetical protein